MKRQLAIYLILNTVTCLFAINGEHSLLQNLFVNYSTEARPVENDTDPVQVSIGIELNQIVSLNEKGETLALFIFVRQYWNDPSLKWDPEKYNNVTTINISPHNIWLPDIVLENNVEKDYSFGGSLDTLKNRVIIKSNGDIKWLTPALLTSKCPMNIQYFPFDTQVCELVFLSWTYTGNQLNLKETEFSLVTYSNHSEWYLEKATVYRKEVLYSCCPDTPFPVVHFKLVLKRRPLFYLLNLILPIVVISMLTMLTFYLPAESGERISFGVTIFLSLTVFMLIVDDLIPATSDTVPLVIVFFTSVLLEMVVMMIVMCYILRLYLKSPEDEPMSKWMRHYIYDNLAYKLGMRRKGSGSSTNHVTVNGGAFEMENLGDSKRGREELPPGWFPSSRGFTHQGLNGSTAVINRANGKSTWNTTTTRTTRPLPNDNGVTRPHKDSNGTYQLDTVFMMKIDTIIQRFDKEDEEKDKLNEWRVCAMTIDRSALIVFSIILLATALGCFLSAP